MTKAGPRGPSLQPRQPAPGTAGVLAGASFPFPLPIASNEGPLPLVQRIDLEEDGVSLDRLGLV